MIRKLLATLAFVFASVSAMAQIEANKASAAELDSVSGIGPALSQRIIDARKQGDFKDWADFTARVKGVKDKAATKLSAAGLTVNGKPYGAAATTAAAAKPAAAAKK